MHKEHPQLSKAKKPSVLYHSSPDRNIEVFEPRALSVRDPLEGPVVFATPDKAYASMFIVPASDSWTTRGRFVDESGRGDWHMVIADKQRFIETDKGGEIYELPAEGFVTDPDRSLHGVEWVSRSKVKPIGRQEYQSGLQAMQDLGVRVYFVNAEVLKAIRESADHGKAIIDSL